VIINL